jgi:hypothetical protein
MFIPLLGFTDTDCTGRTYVVFFLHENPQFVSVKGTTKKADAFGLFVYPNFTRRHNTKVACPAAAAEGRGLQKFTRGPLKSWQKVVPSTY